MTITEEQVRYVAGLANLTLTAEEIPRMAADLTGILGHMDKLNEVDTSDVEPMAQVLFDTEETATLRADEGPAPSGSLACGSMGLTFAPPSRRAQPSRSHRR